MALNASVGTLSIASTDTSKTISLASNFDPKAIILWSSRLSADSDTAVDGELYMGMATYRGAAVQQFFSSTFWKSALASSDNARGRRATACLKGYSDQVTPTVDFELRLTSMSVGATSNVVISVFDAPAATILVHYLILGGSDITDAFVASPAESLTSPQSVTITAGFGQPDLLLFMGFFNAAAGAFEGNGNGWNALGAAKSDTERQSSSLVSADASTTIQLGAWQKQRAMAQFTGVSADAEADLDVKANWPADGFQLVWPDLTASASNIFGYLALKGTFQSAIGVDTALTAGSTKDTAIGFPPVAALLFHVNGPNQPLINVTGPDLGYWGMGATDGTTEAHAGISEDDAATDSTTYRTFSQTKGLRFFKPTGTIGQAPTKMSEADLSFSGDNLRSSWTTLDSVAREWCYLVLGSAPAAGASARGRPRTRTTIARGLAGRGSYS